MRIQWLGQACFLITSESGVRIIIDPYDSNDRLAYEPVQEAADAVLVTHSHDDHNNVLAVLGQPEIIKEPGRHRAAGIEVHGIPTFHDADQGKLRGPNTVVVFSLDGLRLCHVGDLGHLLTAQQIQELGPVDILFPPVGGLFSLDAETASLLCEQLHAKLAFPMHYKTEKVAWPFAPVEDFLELQPRVHRVGSSYLDIRRDQLPLTTETIVLVPGR